MARRTKAEVDAQVEHYARLLGLTEWHIKTRIGYNPDDDQSLDVDRRPRCRFMEITFYPYQFEKDESDWFTLEDSVIHELLHSMFAPLIYGLVGIITDEEGETRAHDHYMWVRENLEEPLIAVLSRLLARYLPKPKAK